MKVRSQMVAPSARVRRYRFGDGQKVMRRYLGLLDNAAEPDDIATSAQIRGPPTSTASHEKPPTLSHETVILREFGVCTPFHDTYTPPSPSPSASVCHPSDPILTAPFVRFLVPSSLVRQSPADTCNSKQAAPP
ncbi:hypothetical protein CMEL01_14467 [Colletotrichum melonis]|uniref:Uncharacterized protein n=1 Tax=Colletotrichum melonis TaxID=1209925 RepID=A0AAI9UQJ3_9PEZI|nr:hypothetical protein CMEL01_14467 [Colletotrichum melonis]